MKSPQELLKSLKRGPTDVVGVDVSGDEARMVRMRRSGDSGTVVAVAVAPLAPPVPGKDGDALRMPPLDIPAPLRGQHAALAVSGDAAVVRLLTFPGRDADVAGHVVDGLGLDSTEGYRVSYKQITEAGARAETRVVAVALPEDRVTSGLARLPDTRIPAPHTVEISSLAAVTAFLNGPALIHEGDTIGVVVFDEQSSLFALFKNRLPVLMRKLERGTGSLLRRVEDMLGVDRATARGIMSDGSFDISQAARETLEPLVKQLIVSRDFVERRENCRVSALYVGGYLVGSRDTQAEIRNALEVDVAAWNPFEGLTVNDNALPASLEPRSHEFAAAVGACQGTLEAS